MEMSVNVFSLYTFEQGNSYNNELVQNKTWEIKSFLMRLP